MDLDDVFSAKPTGQQHVARKADITLASADDLQFEFSDGGLGFDLGPSDGIGSNDFDGDLGISFEDENDQQLRSEDAESVEVGRDAAVRRGPRESFGSELLGRADIDMDDLMSNRSRAPSEHPLGNDFGEFGFAPGEQMDLDLGLTFEEDEREKTPGQTRSPRMYLMFVRLSELVFDTHC
jgi:cohesin complex subunit SCC1